MTAFILPQPQPFAIPATYGLRGTAGAAGAAGGNVMAIGLAKDAGSITFPVGAKLVRTYGNEGAANGVADYVQDASVDVAFIAAHPKGGIRDSAGTGARILAEERLNSRTQYEATDPDYTMALKRSLDYLKSIAQNADGWIRQGSVPCFTPPGDYDISDTLDFTHTVIFEGAGTMGGYATRLRWTTDVTALRIQGDNTTGASGTGSQPSSGAWTWIRQIDLAGPYFDSSDFTGNTEAEHHAIHCRANYLVTDCRIDGFSGDGIRAFTSVGGGGAEEGNSNTSQVRRTFITNVRDALSLDGADSNAGTFEAVIATYCRRRSVWDSGFLASLHMGHHSANAGLIPGVAPCVVTSGGNRYAVRAGQAVGASTNAPSGTTADNTWWLYMAAGGAASWLNIAAWVSGTTYREGGSYKTDSLNGYAQFINCYSEGGEAPAQFIKPTLVQGGLWGTRDPVWDTAGNPGNRLGGSAFELLTGGRLGPTRIESLSSSAPQQIIHNNATLASGLYARTDYCQGFEDDGVTPMVVAGIRAWSSTSSAATAEGTIYWFARTKAGGGAITDLLTLDGTTGTHPALGPVANAGLDLANPSFQFRNAYLSNGLFVGGNKVLGARATGWVAPTGTATRSTFATSTVTLSVLAEHVKALIDDMTTHGAIGT